MNPMRAPWEPNVPWEPRLPTAACPASAGVDCALAVRRELCVGAGRPNAALREQQVSVRIA